jgi:hypothetical protein
MRGFAGRQVGISLKEESADRKGSFAESGKKASGENIDKSGGYGKAYSGTSVKASRLTLDHCVG